MPFTFSHPAIVLPLTYLPKRWISLTGLIIGSLTPDFEYFIRMRIQSNYSHTIFGLIWFDLPVGVILTFIFHDLVRDSFFDNLPAFLKSRFFGFRHFNWDSHFKKNWLIIIISILIGVMTHLLWDSFTHSNGYFVLTIPSLTDKIDLLGRQIQIYKLLQHSSTLIGGLILVIVIYKLPRDKTVSGHISLKYWSYLISLTIAIIILRFICGLNYRMYGQLIVTVISACIISLILIPLIIKIKTTGANNGYKI